MSARKLGRLQFRINGQVVDSKRGSTLMPGGEKRTPVVGSRSVHGFSAELMAPELSVKLTQSANLTVTDVANITDATGLWIGDDGVSYTLVGLFCTEPPTLNENEGEIDAKFSATSCERV